MTKKIISITRTILDRSVPVPGHSNVANQKRASNATTVGLSTPLRPRTGALRAALLFNILLLCSSAAFAAIPPAEKLLPPDTLAVVSAPDWTKLREVYKKSPQSQFWDDAAMKPFRAKFAAKWSEEFVKPLERDLGVKLADYEALLQGQLTFAVTQEGWQGKAKDDGVPAFVFLLDAKDKSDLLKKNLADLRKKWSADGKAIKTEKIRDVEFSIVPLTTNDMPKTLRQFFPQQQNVEELGKEGETKEAARDELVIGQHDSLLIVGSTVKVVGKVMARVTAGSAATLADQPDFEAARIGMFRDAPLFGWLNAKTFVDVLSKVMADSDNPDAPSPLPIPSASKIIAAAGLGGLKTVAFNLRDTGDGRTVELFLNAPESTRTGLMKLLAMEPKESTPPAFVPADVVSFARWRLDGQKTIATLEKMVTDVFPDGLSTWEFILRNANEAMRMDEPDYDIRKNIFGNLGDDIIHYEKAPRGKSAAEVASAPSLLLIGSPNAEKLAASLKGLLVILSPSGANPKTREFLGRTIYSFKPPAMTASPGASVSQNLNYAASGGYVAFSADESTLEEFLRSSESQGKALRDTAGLTEAVAKVGGQGGGWLAYENESEKMRLTFDMLRLSAADTNSASRSVIDSMIPFASPEKQFKDWLDFALLPDYAKISKYFGFSVWSANSSVNGITFKYYSPTPAQLKK